MARVMLAGLLLLAAGAAASAAPFHSEDWVIPRETFFNHAPCIVELPDGDLLISWYHGAKGNKDDDVMVEGARKPDGARSWGPRFVMADTPGYPDGNACMVLDSKGQLMFFWPTLLANSWVSALMKYRVSTNFGMSDSPPVWEWQEVLHVTPVDLEQQLNAGMEGLLAAHPEIKELRAAELEAYQKEVRERAADKLQHRLGWMVRARPLVLPSGRVLVPLYTDAFSISVMVMTDDGGKTWVTSGLIVGDGPIQPSVVRRNDGSLVAMMRAAGLRKRIQISESKDDGMTWTMAQPSELPNPGSGIEVIRLTNGHWILAYNDTERGRHQLAVAISADEGKTWKWMRHLEQVAAGGGYFAYPSALQTRDGLVHVAYVYEAGPGGRGIKHVTFNEEWVMQGDL